MVLGKVNLAKEKEIDFLVLNTNFLACQFRKGFFQ
jgi:hypothetical protein